MKILKKLIGLHKILFGAAVFFTFLSAFFNLCWNKFLADMLDRFGNTSFFEIGTVRVLFFKILVMGIFLIFVHTISEYVSSYLAFYTCELFAHDMRMGYVRYYLQSDIQSLAKLNVGEEQSAMQNELKDISHYLKENLFSFMKQLVSFGFAVTFLFCQNWKLALLSTLPVVPLIIYCYFSGKRIKSYTEQCQKCKKEINGLTGTLLELFPVIQVYRVYKLTHNLLKERLFKWEKANVKKERATAKLMSFSGLLSFLPLLLLFGFGGAMVIRKEITLGVFYIFINLSGNVSGFLQNMPGIYADFRRFSASVGRLEAKLVLEES